jgi:hypothetical protein
MKDELVDLLEGQCESAWGSMIHELNTDESIEYRRGFRVGRLVAALELKADVSNIMRLEQSHEEA